MLEGQREDMTSGSKGRGRGRIAIAEDITSWRNFREEKSLCLGGGRSVLYTTCKNEDLVVEDKSIADSCSSWKEDR